MRRGGSSKATETRKGKNEQRGAFQTDVYTLAHAYARPIALYAILETLFWHCSSTNNELEERPARNSIRYNVIEPTARSVDSFRLENVNIRYCLIPECGYYSSICNSHWPLKGYPF